MGEGLRGAQKSLAVQQKLWKNSFVSSTLLLWCGLSATPTGLRFFRPFADDIRKLCDFAAKFDSIREGLYDSRPSRLGR